MERSQSISSGPHLAEEEMQPEEIERFVLSLPKAKGHRIYGVSLYQGFWFHTPKIRDVMNFQRHFQALDQDIILASKPKSGTTWLKSLLFSVVNRSRFTPSNTPLLTSNPHELVPFFELKLYHEGRLPDLTSIQSPRLFSTHIPYSAFPESIKKSACRIVYICRNPLDVVVSYWQFGIQGKSSSNLSLEECVDSFCKGEEVFGPLWDHVLGYRTVSLEQPKKVFFLTYEELKADIKYHLKRLAEFVGCPFSVAEEKQGVIEEISNLCSISNLKELKVNKIGQFQPNFENKCFFRKGAVGDWANYLTPSMVERLEKVMKEKFEGSGLSFKISS